jgi:signal transduction histidine kinase
MTAHLSTEEDYHMLEVYLEHYTHINDVIIHYKDNALMTLYTNDVNDLLSHFEEVYYEDSLVGYLAISFESSLLGKDMFYGFIWLNIASLSLFAIGISMMHRFLRKENVKMNNDLNHMGQRDAKINYIEMNQLQQKLLSHSDQRDKQKLIYESHIKSLAHDIKTPLSVIQIYTDAMLSHTLKPSDDIFNEIKEETMKISDLIPEFIEAEYVNLPYQQDISIFIQAYIHQYHEIFESKNIKIEAYLESLHLLISDRDLERLISHLIFNAFYYSHPNSSVVIQIVQNDKTLIIKDHGIGMSNETIKRIHEGPYRAKEAIELNEKGSGIGYQMIKEILKKISGEYQIESQMHQGTQVTIRFQ